MVQWLQIIRLMFPQTFCAKRKEGLADSSINLTNENGKEWECSTTSYLV